MTDKVKYHQLRDRNTGATIHPETSARQVLMPGGTNLHEAFTALTGTLSGKQDTLASSPDVTITPSAQYSPPQLKLTDFAKHAVFDDLFLAAGGTWARIDHSHTNDDGTPSPYYLNELWLTYEEAVTVYLSYSKSQNQSRRYYATKARTNIPVEGKDFGSFATSAKLLEAARISYMSQGTLDRAFYGCAKMRSLHLFMDSPSYIGGMLNGCAALEDLKIKGLRLDLYIGDSPHLTAESFEYIISNRAGTNAITVTLHPDVYNKIIEAAGADPESEWSGILELAASKNITFASA